MARMFVRAAILVAAIILAGCPLAGDNNAATDALVLGTYSGVVYDALTGQGLPGVTVEMAGNTTETTQTGLFVITNIPGGTYAVAFSRDGYLAVESRLVEFDPLTFTPGYLSGEPLGETQGSVREAAPGTFGVSDGAFGMWPLSGGISGQLQVEFTSVGNNANLRAREMAQAGVIVYAAVRQDETSIGNDAANPDSSSGNETGTNQNRDIAGRAIFRGTVGANGRFEMTGIPAGVELDLYVRPFAQDYQGVSYYFGNVNADPVLERIVAAVDTDADPTPLDEVVIRSRDGGASIVEQAGFGEISAPLVANATFSLTFSKSISPNNFRAFLDSGGNGVYDVNTDDRLLEVSWSDNGLTGTFAPQDDPDSDGDESVLPYGYDETPMQLIIDRGLAADGSEIEYRDTDGEGSDVPGIDTNSDGLGDETLKVYTLPALELLSIEYLDTNGVVLGARRVLQGAAPEAIVMPSGGQIRFTFNKSLDTTFAEAELFDTDGQTPPGTNGYTFVDTSKIDTPAIANGADSSTATVNVPSGLTFGQDYLLAVSIRTDGTPVETYVGSTIGDDDGADGLAWFEFGSVLQPLRPETNTDTTFNLTRATVGSGAVTFGPTDATGTAASNDLPYRGAIRIEFSEPITANPTVELAAWNDDGDDIVEADELVALSVGSDVTVTREADSVSDTPQTVVQIAFVADRYPGSRYVLRVEAESTGSSFQMGANEYFVFATKSTIDGFTAPASLTTYPERVEGLAIASVTGAYTGVDSADTTVGLTWTSREELYGETGVYSIYRRSVVPTDRNYSPVATANEISWLASLFSTAITATDNSLSADGLVTPIGPINVNALVFDGTATYLIAARTAKGFAAYSSELEVTDTIPPTGSFTSPLVAQTNGGTATVTQQVEFQATEVVATGTIQVVDQPADSAVTVSVDQSASALDEGLIVFAVAIPAGSSVVSGDTLTFQFADTSGNTSDRNRVDDEGGTSTFATQVP